MPENPILTEMKQTAFLISAPSSGSGKTTISRAIMAALCRRGLRVQPFKCGPDYIDTKFHEAVCGRGSVNLDTFMSDESHVIRLFSHYSQDADVSVVEGMMGLFDGYNRDLGSAAHVARTIEVPVVLVVDARSSAYSLAALLRGFTAFDSRLRLARVIYNKVGSERHARMLREVSEECGVKCIGCVPRMKDMEQQSRYLGLDFSTDSQALDALVALAEEHIDLDDLMSLECNLPEKTLADASLRQPMEDIKGTICIARNAESFSFLYKELIDSMQQSGSVCFIDPETTPHLPADTQLLILPGGYPEKHLQALNANASLREDIRLYAEKGGRIEAECGGMMYLCRSIVSDEGEFEMCNVLPYKVSSRKCDRKLSLGYRTFTLNGKEYKGHEFHYSQFLKPRPESVCEVKDARGNVIDTPVFTYKNVTATWIHRSLSHSNAPATLPQGGVRRGASLLFAGTGSDVGKSLIVAGICRILRQDGLNPAPFKAQNMALNSYVTPEGLEIGRAQAVQAEAAGIPCHTDMNPLLLKPQSDHTSQVVLNGKPMGTSSAYDYFRKEGREHLRKAVCEAFDRLSSRYNPIIMEGAGSISEINLRNSDLVNMPMARYADADVILVADIDRGGVFASVYGSVMLQTPEDRRRIKGVIINKFRGDIRLFEKGCKQIEDLCGIPVLGVVPYMSDVHIEEEDSVDLEKKAKHAKAGMVNIAVVMLKHISNFTDFDALEHDPRIHLFYATDAQQLRDADIIIVPGTKSTISDLAELRRSGMAEAVQHAHREGTLVIGICGGYQMLGREVLDPLHVEGEQERMPGLNLLPLSTTMTSEKTTQQVEFTLNPSLLPSDAKMHGYEIHMGETKATDQLENQTGKGNDKQEGSAKLIAEQAKDQALCSSAPASAASSADVIPLTSIGGHYRNNCIGTYIHGIFDNQPFIEWMLSLTGKDLSEQQEFDYSAYKEEQYDLLADHLRKHIDMHRIHEIISKQNLRIIT